MNQIQNQGQNIVNIFSDLLGRFFSFLPGLIGAIVIVIIGLIIAALVAKLVEKIVRGLRIDHVIATLQHEIQGRPGREVKASVLLREVVRWFLIFIFLMAAAEALGLQQLSAFLNNIILYIPNVIVAVIILTVSLLFGKYISDVVMASQSMAANSLNTGIVASVAKWAIIIFGVSAALIQLGVAVSLVNIVFTGIVFALALAAGIAFGLGGQAEAAIMWKKMRDSFRR